MSEIPRFHFLRLDDGRHWPVVDPVRWCLDNAQTPLLERARDRLLTLDESASERILNVTLRRCGLNLIEVVTSTQMTQHFWTRPGDLHPFCKHFDLARPEVQVAQLKRKNGTITVLRGDELLKGIPLPAAFPFDTYELSWLRRHADDPDDWSAAPASFGQHSWEGIADRHIPWTVLKAVWRRDPERLCPNCDQPLCLWNFDYHRTGLLSFGGILEWLCFACRRNFEATEYGKPWPLKDLPVELLPRWWCDPIYKKVDLTAWRAKGGK